MTNTDPIRRLGVYDWGTHPCPASALSDELAGSDLEVDVCDLDTVDEFDGVVTVYHHDEFLNAVDWVHTIRSGYDDFPLDAYEERGVIVTNSTGIAGDLVAESAIGLLCMLAKGFHRFRDAQAEHEWGRLPWRRPFELGESTACIVGLGQIGSSVAARAGVLGMDVTGVDVRPVSTLGLDRIHDVETLTDAVRDARFVVLTTPLNDATHGLVDAEVLAAMRDDAFVVNVSRGAIVDEDALEAALDTGEIAGAALDVFETEPLPEGSPLWDMEEVIVTPHAAAQSVTYGERVARLIETNVGRFDHGAEPWNRVV
ncbi:D-2-hydroxyacid dehydrogenase [Halococcus hamelinensis]|uniref:Phosphoglycerate dehydrogenase n=1 Tax=Halococcus hamelinensis 100A6 TaxID=1132509 RepID=M0LY36_9EURY|nr:D-2-hydroxyacid dehydrogenase [Halococcus hamelinensis]EMA37279.1 phosphoglycerate dehydrogenase [Halococcus hamelinensis 100A6]